MNSRKMQSYIRFMAIGVACILAPKAFAAVDTTAGNAGFQFLDIPPSPRQIAMGWTGTALGEDGFAYYNPASPAIDKTSFLSVGYAPLPFDYSIEHAQGTCMISNFFIGANITNHVVTGIYPTDFGKDPDYNTPFSDDGTLISLNAGFINDRLGLGLALNGLQEQIGTATAYGVSASAGLVYALTPNIELGAAGLHLGTTTGFTDATRNFGQGYPLPRSARAGVAYCDTLLHLPGFLGWLRHLPYSVSGDVVYRDVGLGGTPVSQRLNRVTVPLGIEVRPTSYVAVRLGKRLNDDSELLTFGGGLHWSMLSFDFAIALANIVSDIQVQPFFSLSYSLKPASGEIPKVKAPAAPSNVIIEKPVEVQGVAPVAPPVPASKGADSATAQPAAPSAATQPPLPVAAPQDSIPAAKDNAGNPAESKPVDQTGKSGQADSVQTKQPDAPVTR
jgi:hypothetical protein